MTKGSLFMRVGFSLLASFIVALGVGARMVRAESYRYTLQAGSYEIVDAKEDYQRIKMAGFGYLLDPGKPKLPSQIFAIAVPPGATIDAVETRGIDPVVLDGTYRIEPAPMVSALSDDANEVAFNRLDYNEILRKAYASEDPYPEVAGFFEQQGAYRKYDLAMVRYSPFAYKPKSGQLTYYPGMEVTITYSQTKLAAPETESLMQEFVPEAEDRAAEYIINYPDAQSWYPAAQQKDAVSTGGFVIITTAALEDAVWPIQNWETCKGRDVHVATVEYIDSAYSGSDRAARIRTFLRTYLGAWGILKVMLIGEITDVPMRKTYPRGSDGDGDGTHWEEADGVPTDYYYAELSLPDSTSWNSNTVGNDYYMYGHQGYDNVQFPNEVDVGRIPWSDPSLVEDICMKMVEFEYSTDMSHKLNYLFTGAYFWDDTDNAVLKTYIINNALDPGNPPTRIYEQDPSCWNSAYYSEYAMSRYITRQVWGNDYGDGPFGYVNLAGHGSSSGIVAFKERHPTCSPEAYFYGAADCPHLDDSHPAIVFSNACSTGWPENANNLGKKLLEHGGVGVVASNRTAYGAHGWDDPSDGNCSTLDWLFTDYAARTDGDRSSVGWSLQTALQTMYSTYNWNNSWWQFFEWNLYSNPDLWINNRPSLLPNLEDITLSGWAYPIVPRNTDNATATWCPMTTTLTGNSTNTWFNWSWTNSGIYDAPRHRTTVYVDGDWYFYSEPTLPAGSNSTYRNSKAGLTISGGRHSVYYRLDEDDKVWETSEGDNCWGRQFVWSPYALADDTPVTRGTPTEADAWGCAPGAWFNNDGFSFNLQWSHPNKYWSAVGILPYNAGADYDLRLWDIGDYTGSEGGFGGGYLEYSQWGAGASDFVIVNDNTAPSGIYYAGVLNRLDGLGNYRIEEATSTKIYPGTNGPYTLGTTGVLDIYETNETTITGLSAGDWGFKLVQTAGTCDLGMSLYDDETVHSSKSEYMSGGYANSNGNGADEFMQVTIPDAGWHGLAVWKVDASDYSKSATYRIKMGKCGSPDAPTGPSPPAGATNVSINADLNWSDCAGAEYYEVWFREGSGAWTLLGTTENSAWALGTLNETTIYYWQIKAVNICGSYLWGPLWAFTTISSDVCECNLNADHSCNILDYQLFIQDWGSNTCGTPPGSGDPPNDCECDLNTDGDCNILDYQIFIQDWGRDDCP